MTLASRRSGGYGRRVRVLVLWLTMLGCGGVPGHENARSTVHATAGALADIEARSQNAEVRTAVEQAQGWLGPAEDAVDVWEDGGQLRYEEIAACLGVAMTYVRHLLTTASEPVSRDFEQAEAQVLGATDRECAP